MAKCGNHDLVLVIGCASVLKRTLEVLVWFTVLAFTHIVSAQEFVTNQPAFRLLSVSNPPVTNLPTSINPLRAPSRYSASNQNLSHEPTGTFSNDINFVIPLIRFEDVPLTTAIENLARLADVNYLLDPDLEQDWMNSGEPVATLRWKSLTAYQALQRLLNQYELALIEDPASNIAYIVRTRQGGGRVSANFPSIAPHPPTSPTSNFIPQIVFSDVPITTVIENLARLENINYIINWKISDSWSGLGPDATKEPLLSLRFNNITARNTLERILNIRGLVLRDDPETHVSYIMRSSQVPPKVNATLLDITGTDAFHLTNSPTTLRFSNVPLNTILNELIHRGKLPVKIDPQVESIFTADKSWKRIVSLRWEGITPKQAIVAICKSYDLDLVKDAVTDEIWIKPGKVKRRHHFQLR